MKLGIILAAGKGSRLNCTTQNKTTLQVNGKSLIQYGTDLFAVTMDEILVVIGAFANSVREALKDDKVLYAVQEQPNGTGQAVQVAVDEIERLGIEPSNVFVGYGDHLMFYTPEVIRAIESKHDTSKAIITLVSVITDKPDELAWGRIIRNGGMVEAIIEQKDATTEQRTIQEQNAGFYCFEYKFLRSAIKKIHPSPVTNEIYITDLIKIARQDGMTVVAHQVPFEQVGSGINTPEQLSQTQQKLECDNGN